MYRNVQLSFADVPLANSEKAHIFKIIERIDESAPSDSRLSFVVGQTKDFIKINCEVLSSHCLFSSEAISQDPIVAALEIEEDMIQKLENWKSQRFPLPNSLENQELQKAI